MQRMTMTRKLIVLLALLAVLPARSQDAGLGVGFEELMKSLPSTLKLKDLSNEWRQVTIGAPPEMAMALGMNGPRGQPVQSDLYFTKGQTVTVGSDTYMIAYHARPNPDPRDPRARRFSSPPELFDEEGKPLAPKKLPPDTSLTLSLLNLRTTSSLNDIRTFDPVRDVQTEEEAEKEKERAINQASVSNLKQIGLALLQYVQDYDLKMPPMKSAVTEQEVRQAVGQSGNGWPQVTGATPVQARLQPYTRSIEIFLHPTTREPYRANPYLSYKNESEIDNPATMVAFYEARPAQDGRRAAVFLDGHVRRIPEAEWPQVKRVSKIDQQSRAAPRARPPQPLKTNPAPVSKPPPRQ